MCGSLIRGFKICKVMNQICKTRSRKLQSISSQWPPDRFYQQVLCKTRHPWNFFIMKMAQFTQLELRLLTKRELINSNSEKKQNEVLTLNYNLEQNPPLKKSHSNYGTSSCTQPRCNNACTLHRTIPRFLPSPGPASYDIMTSAQRQTCALKQLVSALRKEQRGELRGRSGLLPPWEQVRGSIRPMCLITLDHP